jgi:hypothetical protein
MKTLFFSSLLFLFPALPRNKMCIFCDNIASTDGSGIIRSSQTSAAVGNQPQIYIYIVYTYISMELAESQSNSQLTRCSRF